MFVEALQSLAGFHANYSAGSRRDTTEQPDRLANLSAISSVSMKHDGAAGSCPGFQRQPEKLHPIRSDV